MCLVMYSPCRYRDMQFGVVLYKWLKICPKQQAKRQKSGYTVNNGRGVETRSKEGDYELVYDVDTTYGPPHQVFARHRQPVCPFELVKPIQLHKRRAHAMALSLNSL
jgi:hypothetical protein